MKSTTTARMPETTLIRVTLSISSPQRGFATAGAPIPLNHLCGLAFAHCRVKLLSLDSAYSYSMLLLVCSEIRTNAWTRFASSPQELLFGTEQRPCEKIILRPGGEARTGTCSC